MKAVMVVVDGLFDEPSPSLGGKTPLEASETRTLRRLAERSVLGVVENVVEGEVTSDVAVANLLGLEASNLARVPRSILEVVAEGIDFIDGNLALHCNFATLDTHTMKIVDRRVGRSLTRGEARILEKDINSKVKLVGADFAFRHIVDYVGVLVLRDEKIELSDQISDTDPWREGEEKVLKPCRPLSQDESAVRASALLNEFTTNVIRVLEDHPVNTFRRRKGLLPANSVICRQPGNRLPRIEKRFADLFGLEGCFQARLPTERGIATLLGLRPLQLPLVEPFENLGAYYYERARIVAEKLRECDFVYVHLDEADDAAHDRDPLRKKFVIETLDEYFLGPLYDALADTDVTLIVTADHWTSSRTGHHLNRPLPVLVHSRRFAEKVGKTFSERITEGGYEFWVNAKDFLKKVIFGFK